MIEIKKNKLIGYDTIGIYRIGVLQSHAPEHYLIKKKNKFKIFSIKEINEALAGIISFSKKNNVEAEVMFFYIRKVMSMYEFDYHDRPNFKK